MSKRVSWWRRAWGYVRDVVGGTDDSRPVEAQQTSKSAHQKRASHQKASGVATQFPTMPGGAEARDLVIGLDFGTSCTKVVIRSPFVARGHAIAVPFDGFQCARNRYLILTRVYESLEGSLSLGKSPGSREHQGLKVGLLGTRPTHEQQALAAAYLALLLREIRSWFLSTQQRDFGHFNLRWELNLGIPSAGHDDESVRDAFLLTARAAWVLSIRPGIVTRARALEAISTARKGDACLPADVSMVAVTPEVAAEAAGYARSPMRPSGLHVLVDVGATTLDVCGFLLRDVEGENEYALLRAVVEHLGTLELEKAHRKSQGLEPGTPDPMEVPKIPIQEYPEQFAADCVNALMRVIMDIKQRRDPHCERLRTGLPLFLCGGGSRVEFYDVVVSRANRRFRSAVRTEGIKAKALPLPSELDSPDLEGSFDRVAVAYGLSYGADDIGEIVPPSKIDDVPERSRRNLAGRFVSKDQV